MQSLLQLLELDFEGHGQQGHPTPVRRLKGGARDFNSNDRTVTPAGGLSWMVSANVVALAGGSKWPRLRKRHEHSLQERTSNKQTGNESVAVHGNRAVKRTMNPNRAFFACSFLLYKDLSISF